MRVFGSDGNGGIAQEAGWPKHRYAQWLSALLLFSERPSTNLITASKILLVGSVWGAFLGLPLQYVASVFHQKESVARFLANGYQNRALPAEVFENVSIDCKLEVSARRGNEVTLVFRVLNSASLPIFLNYGSGKYSVRLRPRVGTIDVVNESLYVLDKIEVPAKSDVEIFKVISETDWKWVKAAEPRSVSWNVVQEGVRWANGGGSCSYP